MDRRLAHKNIVTGLIVSALQLVVFALTFVAAYLYLGG